MVYNIGLPHSLLSDYEMHEASLIVDNVSKRHRVDDNGILGSQTITFTDGKSISLFTKATLMMFTTELPTLTKYETFPVYDIGIEN